MSIEKDIEKLRPKAKEVSEILKHLAHKDRLLILCLLSKGEMNVSQMMRRVNIDQVPLSQHLMRLRKSGMVKTRREGKFIFYSLADGRLGELFDTLQRLYCDIDN